MAPRVAYKTEYPLKGPKELSPRISWLRDYYFKGYDRRWNNEFTSWTTGTPWDLLYQEMTYYIVPEVYMLMDAHSGCFHQAARPVKLHQDFWEKTLPERKAWLLREVMLNYVPQEILPGDLLAGARFNVVTSTCFSEDERKTYDQKVTGKAADGRGDWDNFSNCLPNGASHTMTFNPSIIQDPEHKEKFKAFLRGYIENGGTALQTNILDPAMLKKIPWITVIYSSGSPDITLILHPSAKSFRMR
jgi:hypothetical protein